MMRIKLLLFAMLISAFAMAQNGNFWSTANESAIQLGSENDRGVIPSEYHTFELDLDAIKNHLRDAPMERTAAARNQKLSIEFPLPDGSIHEFEIVESPVMMPGLASRFPHIKSFSGRSTGGEKLNTRFVYSDHGFHAIFYSTDVRYYIQPYASGLDDAYIVYDRRNVETPGNQSFTCGVSGSDMFGDDHNPMEGLEIGHEEDHQHAAESRDADVEVVDIREYRMAVAGLAEWTNTHNGGTVSGGLSAVNIMANTLNSFFEPEMAVRFVLVENNDEIIYTDPLTDPYNDVDNQNNSLLGQNQSNLDITIGSENYDIGHLMTLSCVGIGGVASLNSICQSNSKGAGLTCQGGSNLIFIVSEIAAHEVAHQFSATHTWNNCEGTIGSPPQDIISARSSGTAYEPGSGSTILSYSGGCQSQNVQFGSDYYYHVASLDQMYTSVEVGNGSDCANITPSTNNFPELELAYEDGFYIPINTPFELTAIGSDQDGDDLTYCWEQYNLGPVSDLGTPLLNGPSFRSWSPTESPTRVFPRMQSVVLNSQLSVEVLPTYTRNLTFRCTARDNNPEIGGVVWEELSFEATDAAGPFRVEYPNTNGLSFEKGQYFEALWDVANTDAAPVNAAIVDIKMSIDGGYTYPYTLATNVPNDGAQFVTIPDILSTTARIRVEASENIFFDISNFNFEIVEPSEPGFAFSAGPFNQQICSPDDAIVNLNVFSLLDYDSLVTFSISGLPAGANPIFSENPAVASTGDITLTIETADIVDEGLYTGEIMAIAPNADTLFRTINFNIVLNDFSAMAPVEPANGSSGAPDVPDFIWNGTPNAVSYDIQIATSPSFAPETIVEESFGVTDPNFSPTTVLEKNTLYFWRIRPQNECGYGEYSLPQGFHTEVFECSTFETTTPQNISGIGTPVVESTIVVNSEGIINDLNVTQVKGSHDLVQHLDVSLISPDNTEVVLFAGICGVATAFNASLDDESPIELLCPPIGVFQPQGSLSDFNGTQATGIWTLKIAVNNTDGTGGNLESWKMQLCSNASANPPVLITNEVMPVPPGQGRQVTNDFLLVEDPDNTPEELTYTLVTVPENGTLFFLNTPLEVGGTFRQATINAGNLTYVHNGGAEVTDAFTFAVEDGAGGWFGTPQFDIEVDPNVMVGTENLEESNAFSIFPNPAQNILNLRFTHPINGTLETYITNVQGQVLQSQRFENTFEQVQLNTANLTNGIYFVYVKTEGGTATKKVVIQK